MNTPSAENDAPACAVPAKSNPRYCHLQGVRYNAKPCVGACDLADDTRVIPPASTPGDDA